MGGRDGGVYGGSGGDEVRRWEIVRTKGDAHMGGDGGCYNTW